MKTVIFTSSLLIIIPLLLCTWVIAILGPIGMLSAINAPLVFAIFPTMLSVGIALLITVGLIKLLQLVKNY